MKNLLSTINSWKTLKPLLSNRIMGKNKIHLTENGELIKTVRKIAEILNDFFSNIVQNLDITRYLNKEPFLDNVKDSTIKSTLK